MNKLFEFFTEDNGNSSATRLIFISWNLCLMLVWVYISMKSGTMATIEPGVLIGMGIMQAGKVGGKMAEEDVKSNA